MFKQLMASCVLLTAATVISAADVDAGKTKVVQVCSKCHEVGDWKGKSAAEIQGKIQNVLAGKTKHPKKLELTDADVANVAAYWASAAN